MGSLKMSESTFRNLIGKVVDQLATKEEMTLLGILNIDRVENASAGDAERRGAERLQDLVDDYRDTSERGSGYRLFR